MAEIKKLVQSLTEQVASLKSQPACQCECPSIDEIRQVVREELDRVTVTLKTVSGETKKVEMPLTTKAKAQVKELQPGDVVVAHQWRASDAVHLSKPILTHRLLSIRHHDLRCVF